MAVHIENRPLEKLDFTDADFLVADWHSPCQNAEATNSRHLRITHAKSSRSPAFARTASVLGWQNRAVGASREVPRAAGHRCKGLQVLSGLFDPSRRWMSESCGQRHVILRKPALHPDVSPHCGTFFQEPHSSDARAGITEFWPFRHGVSIFPAPGVIAAGVRIQPYWLTMEDMQISQRRHGAETAANTPAPLFSTFREKKTYATAADMKKVIELLTGSSGRVTT